MERLLYCTFNGKPVTYLDFAFRGKIMKSGEKASFKESLNIKNTLQEIMITPKGLTAQLKEVLLSLMS